MKRSAFTLVLLMATNLFAQSNDLQQDIAAINSQLKEIRTVKGTIDQRLTVRSGSIVSFEMKSIDTKGNRSSESFVMDLADIDPHALNSGIQRNMMKVEVHTVNNQRLIAQINQGEISSYQTTFKLDVEDNDHANALMNALKNAALSAKELEDAKYGYGSYDEIRLDLSSAVKPFSTVTVQKITFDPQRKDKLNVHIQENNGITKRYEFNVKDLNATTLKVEAHGRTLSVPVDAYGGEKVMKLYENDLAKGFVSRFVLYAESVDQAKRIKRLFELAIDAMNGKLPENPSARPQRVSATQIEQPTPSRSTPTKQSAPQEFPKVELTKDPQSGKYSWVGIYELPGHTEEALYKAVEASIASNMIISKSENQIVFQRMGGNGTAMRLGGDAFISFTIKVGVKDNKIRMEETDFFYDNRAWGFSAPQTLETMDAKKLNKIAGDINERLTQGNNAMMKGVMEKIRLTKTEDW